MRSRLEAKFAGHIDGCVPVGRGRVWEYEACCYADGDRQYLPDFSINRKLFFEVKPPNADFSVALDLMHVILASASMAELQVVTQRSQDGPWICVAKCHPALGCGRCERPKQ